MQMMAGHVDWYDRLPLVVRLLASDTALTVATKLTTIYTVPANRRAVLHSVTVSMDVLSAVVTDVGFAGVRSRPSAGADRDIFLLAGTGLTAVENMTKNHAPQQHLLAGDVVSLWIDALLSAVNINADVTINLTEYEEIG